MLPVCFQLTLRTLPPTPHTDPSEFSTREGHVDHGLVTFPGSSVSAFICRIGLFLLCFFFAQVEVTWSSWSEHAQVKVQ